MVTPNAEYGRGPDWYPPDTYGAPLANPVTPNAETVSPRFEPLPVRWYPVVNDLVGGWAVSHVDKPLSMQDFQNGEGDIADFCTETVARHIADLHNTWVSQIDGSER